MESLRPVTDRSSTCAHLGARNGQLPILQWIVMQTGVPTLSVGTASVSGLYTGPAPRAPACGAGCAELVAVALVLQQCLWRALWRWCSELLR